MQLRRKNTKKVHCWVCQQAGFWVWPIENERMAAMVAVPVFTYPIMLHHSVPSLTHPIKQKQNLWLFVLCTYGFLGFLYVCLGIVPPLWLESQTLETISLNWVSSQPHQRKLISRYPVAMLCIYLYIWLSSTCRLSILHALRHNNYTIITLLVQLVVSTELVKNTVSYSMQHHMYG